MNRLLFLSLFCFLGLWACNSGHSRHRRTASDTASGESSGQGGVHGGDVVAAAVMDTSLLSLKTFPSVSLSDVLGQDWKMEDADKTHWNEIFWDSVRDARQFPELALFKDYSMTENARCGIRTGKWEINKSTRSLILHYDHGSSKTYIIRDIAMKQMELIWRRAADSVILELSAEAVIHKRLMEDPFYPANNLWRIRPKISETDDQVRQRVRECVHFYSLFFYDNYQRGEMQISYSGLPNCFIWYNGGIGIDDVVDLDKKWIDCFYSSAQAIKGHDLIVDILRSHTLKWPDHPVSWVKETADVLDQMSDKLGDR